MINDGKLPQVAVVVPCYRVRRQILDVLSRIDETVSAIYVVDDKCPEFSGLLVQEQCSDARVKVIFHDSNLGVGGAVISGFRRAIAEKMDVVVKLDGDGQMDPSLIPQLIAPIVDGTADYTKGNRFFSPEGIKSMPRVRLAGNMLLSFFTKASSGYWNIFDPTNGFVAINAGILPLIALDKVARRYFFESDMLFRLNTIRARVIDVPMIGFYGNEKSSLKPGHIALEFLMRHFVNLVKRILYNYFLRDFSIATLQMVFGLIFLCFGVSFGIVEWIQNSMAGVPATTGTVMLAALPIILGFQMILAFLSYDVATTPSVAISSMIVRSHLGRFMETDR